MDKSTLKIIVLMVFFLVTGEIVFINNKVPIIYGAIYFIIYNSPKILLRYNEIIPFFFFSIDVGIIIGWVSK